MKLQFIYDDDDIHLYVIVNIKKQIIFYLFN